MSLITPNIEKYNQSIDCTLDGRKLVPFIVNVSNESELVCDIQTGITKLKLLQSTIIIDCSKSKTTVLFPDNFIDHINKCTQPFIVINLLLLLLENAHSNLLIINKDKKEIEHFEPHGGMPCLYKLPSKNYELKIAIEDKVIDILFPDYKYISCMDYCPYGVQGKKNFHPRCDDDTMCSV